MSLLDRIVLALVRAALELFKEHQDEEQVKADANAAAEKAATGDPTDAEKFIKDHGGPK